MSNNHRRAVRALTAVLALLAALLIAPSPGIAQVDPAIGSQTENVGDTDSRIGGLMLQLQQIDTALEREGLNDDDIKALRDRLEPVRDAAQAELDRLQPIIARVDDRIAQLGPPPAEGEPAESAEIVAQREVLDAEKAPLVDEARRARLVLVEAEQLADEMTAHQRERFARRLSERAESILSPRLWGEFLAEVPRVLSSLLVIGRDLRAVLAERLTLVNGLILLAALVVVGLLWRVLSRLLDPLTGSIGTEAEVSDARKALAAMVRLIRVGILPLMALVAVYATIRALEIVPERVAGISDALIGGFALMLYFRGIANAYLAARRPAWRLIPLESRDAFKLTSYAVLIGAVGAADRLLEAIGTATVASLSFEQMASGLSALALAALFAVTLRAIVAARRRAGIVGAEAGFVRWPVIRVLTWIALAVIVISTLSGYMALASFAAQQVVSAILIIGMFRLVIIAANTFLLRTTSPTGRLSRFMVREFGLAESTVHQVGTLAAGVVSVLLFIIGATFLLLPWGFGASDWMGWLRRATFGFQIGDVRIAPFAIVIGVAIFALVLLVVRAIKEWIEHTYLPTTSLDTGLRNSISTAVGYVGLGLAIMVAISYAGLDLSNLAIIFGALSVGIGFGLQAVVSNFVCGLILLAERPIKAGDWIVVGNEQGTVRKISVRATEIETFDRASVIIPNSDLITGQVMNWTHSNTLGRFTIAVGVSYDSDPEQVRDILERIVNDHPLVLSFPEPRIFFTDFGASSLDFTVYGYLKEITSTMIVRSELRFAIFRELKAAGIEIPFPQQDLHVRSVDKVAAEALAGTPAAGGATPAAGG